jgi:hypothetical protein
MTHTRTDRNRMFTALYALLAIAASATPAELSPDAARWGQSGHRIVARTAALQLSTRATREVRRLLQGASLAAVSTWPDEVRSERPATGPRHYVNIPVWDATWRPALCPSDECIIGTLMAQQKILADRSRPRAEREEALKWVVHLVGDLHMPLHVGDRGDRGGNDVKLEFGGRQTNLHSLWDTGMISASGLGEEGYVVLLRDRIRRRGDLRQMAAGSVLDWAMESHAAAREVAYPFLPRSLKIEQAYVDIARPVLEDRLLRASVRLAAMLEQALGHSS